ncbi:MAG TPA: ATP-grasp domain-containing protein [Candidatus Binatia bacterium]|jgi:biotin carboxylase|nr:ATP-grasp domain-containing protein [Candidatus Binatia bacterium]
MNLLVTNTRNPQAYSIIRALRPYCEKLVVTMHGKNRLVARLSHAANSRLVDKRYHVPSPEEDWRAGRIQKENTEREEAYIQAILRICQQEKIDTIFPSFDAHVYVFSKNKKRFDEVGVLVTIPDYEAVVTPLDKYRTIRVAEEAGFPCPKTFLPHSEEDVTRMARELGFPLIMKRRFTAAGRGLHLIKHLPELLGKIRNGEENLGTFVMQEYIPGGLNDHLFLTPDKKGDLKMVFCMKTFCHLGRFCQVFAVDSPSSHACVTDATRIIQKLGWWGGITVQTRIDPRDNTPKLMEINPRIGLGLWYRTEAGINEPLMILRIARGEEVEPVRQYPVGALIADPVEHCMRLGLALMDLLVYRFRIGFLGKEPFDRNNRAMSLRKLVHSVKQTYFSGRSRISSPYTKYFFQDPLVSIIWWLQIITRQWIWNRPGELGQ